MAKTIDVNCVGSYLGNVLKFKKSIKMYGADTRTKKALVDTLEKAAQLLAVYKNELSQREESINKPNA